jgi:hypothetical protein
VRQLGHGCRVIVFDKRGIGLSDRPDTIDVDGWTLRGGDGVDTITASMDGYELEIQLEAKKPPVLHEGDGYFEFAPEAESYYYSRTRMSAEGTLTVHGEEREVSGSTWFDQQWGDFLVLDDVGYAAMEPWGGTIETPNIKRPISPKPRGKCRRLMRLSAAVTVVAWTLIRRSPALGSGFLSSVICTTSGAPNRRIQAAFMQSGSLVRFLHGVHRFPS